MKEDKWGNILGWFFAIVEILDVPIFFILIALVLVNFISPGVLPIFKDGGESPVLSFIVTSIFIIGCIAMYIGYKTRKKLSIKDEKDPCGNSNIKNNHWDYM